MPMIVERIRLKKLEFFDDGGEGVVEGIARARVEIALVGKSGVGDSMIVFSVPWHNDFKDLEMQIYAIFEAIAKDLCKASGFPLQGRQ
jgi:hypothetical protein